MYYLSCIFDYRHNPPKPIYAASFNDETGNVEMYQLYFSGVQYPLHLAYKNAEAVKDIIANQKVVLSDFKSYISGFKLDLKSNYDVYDASQLREASESSLANLKKKALATLLKLKSIKPAKWQQVLARASVVYTHLEKMGYYHNYKKCHPVYDLTYTGRSKCLGNNIQGTNDDDIVEHIDDRNEVFVHFDWVAADFRAASLVSGDLAMQKSFEVSDPYTVLHEALDDKEIGREQCKLELFRSLYSLNYETPVLEFYPRFAKWMQEAINTIQEQGYSQSLLGREFQFIEGERSLKSVFNAQIQGTVAHAMQNVLHQVFEIYPNNVLAEVHDSLILVCKKDKVLDTIKEVSRIMLHPLNKILEDNPKFPLKVSIGYKWRQWKPFKEFR
jgi:hypothetical protein